MHLFVHIVLCVIAGFLAGWSFAINMLRFSDEAYSSPWYYLLSFAMISAAFFIGTANV